jgi:hypothetical protein
MLDAMILPCILTGSPKSILVGLIFLRQKFMMLKIQYKSRIEKFLPDYWKLGYINESSSFA